MADKLAEAFIEVRAHVDRLEADFNKARGATQRETTALSSIGARAMSVASVGLAAAATAGVAAIGLTSAALSTLAVQSIKTFASFEKGMNEVFTLLPGISKEAMDKMQAQVLELSKEMSVLPSEVVPALYSALSAGVPPGNVFDFLKTAQQAAKAGVTDLNTAVEGIAAVVNAYGTDIINAQEASDLMFATVKAGITTFPQLSAALSNVTPVSAELGVAFRDVSAWLAQLTAQKIPTATATTSIRAALVELRKEGTKVSDAFQEVSGVSFREFIAQGHNVGEAFALLEKYAKDNQTSLGDLFGSVEAGGAVLGVTGSKLQGFTDQIKSFSEVSGSTKSAFEQMAQGIAFEYERLQSAIERAMIKMGDALAPSLGPVVDVLMQIVTIAEEELTPAFAAVAEAVGAIDPDASGARSLFRAIGDGLIFVTDAMLSAAVALEDIAGSLENVVWFAQQVPKVSPAYWLTRGLMSNTEEERSKRGLSARDALERLRAENGPSAIAIETQRQMKETMDRLGLDAIFKERTGELASGGTPMSAKAYELQYQLDMLKEERKQIIEGGGLGEPPKEPKLSSNGFVGFEEFGRMIQDQLFQAENDRKTEEFQRQMVAFEKAKQDLLERNSKASEKIADKLEKITTAT